MPVTHSSKLNSSLWEVPGCPYELVAQLPGMTLNATGFLKVCKWLGIPFARCLGPRSKGSCFQCDHQQWQPTQRGAGTQCCVCCVRQGPHFSVGLCSAKGIEAQGLNNLLETHGQIPGN